MKSTLKQFVVEKFIALVVATIVVGILSVMSIYNSKSSKINSLFQPAEKLVLLPYTNDSDTLLEASVYADNVEVSGASDIKLLSDDGSSIKYTYTIHEGIEYPYAGLSLWADTKLETINSNMDISEYTHIKIDMVAENSESEMLIVRPLVPDVTTASNSGSRGYFSTQIPLDDGRFTGELSLANDLSTPDWWYASNGITKKECPPADFTNVIEVVFQNGHKYQYEKNVTVTINEISFVKHPSGEIIQEKEFLKKTMVRDIMTTVLLLSLFLVLISSVKFIKTPVGEEDDSEKIVISYDRVEIEEEQNNDLQRITEFIASNYASPEFSVEQLAKGAGVSTSKIPTLLKKQYSMNFKQYLNTVRITEAKRLLLETEHQIVTIAHSVGYNNIPHFNRTFKQVTGLSPKKYRENPEEAIDNLPGTKKE